MDRNMDNNNFYGMPPYNYDLGNDANFDNPMFNPVIQYEQAYMYYRYMTQQMEYKIKCKEYDKMCGVSGRSENVRSSRE